MDQRLPPLYALRAFEVAARHGSFTHAADELAVTQSAISRHIRTLEQDFNCRLFTRKGPRIELTDAGRLLAQGLSEGFSTIKLACSTLMSDGHALRLKAPSTLTMRWLLPRLSRFHFEHRDLEIKLTSAWMDVDNVVFGKEPYDCAVLLSDGVFPADWHSLKLFDEWLIPICSPALAQLAAPRLDHLDQAELIHPSPDRRDWRRWLQATDRLDPRLLATGKVFDTLELGICAAVQGYGIAMGDLAMVADDIDNARLMFPFPSAVATGDSYFLVWPDNHRKSAACQQLAQFLLAEAANIAWPEVRLLAPGRD